MKKILIIIGIFVLVLVLGIICYLVRYKITDEIPIVSNIAILENNQKNFENNEEKIENQITDENNTESPKILEEQENGIETVKQNNPKNNVTITSNNETEKKKEEKKQEEKIKEEQKITSNKENTIKDTNATPVKKEETTKKEDDKQTSSSNNNKENTNITQSIPKCTDTKHGMAVGNSNKWFNTKDEAIALYNAEIKKWGNLWTSFKIDDEEYKEKCPYGYEIWSCPYCEKWTINFYYN